MLQKLRIKFVALAMCVLFIVLAIIIGTVNLLNYRHIVTSSDSTLEILMENDGKFPDAFGMRGKPFRRMESAETPFETRFFTIRLDKGENVLYVDTMKIAAITEDDVVSYAKQALNSKKDRGFIGDYRYAVQEKPTEHLIVFLDCGRLLNAVKSFLMISAGISLAGYGIVFVFLYIFSDRIVKPIADGYEKQKQFITNVGHDLKTPLTIIDADTDIPEMDYGENEWCQDIKKQTKRLTGLIQELIFLSRMEEKGNQFQMIDFPISDIVSETAQSFESRALTLEKNLVIQVEPFLSYCGDEKSVRQLVTILLDNALKYSDDRGSIVLSLTKTERILRLTVENTCPPIAAEDMKYLFGRFYRTDKSRNSQTGGYGIGLSVAKAIVEAHKGTVKAIMGS